MGRSGRVSRAIAIASLLAVAAPSVARAPDTYEGLYKVKSKRFDVAYLRSGVDFRQYTKVMIDTPEVAFDRNWQRDYNSSQRDLNMRISDEDAVKMLQMAREGVSEVYAKEFAKGGYAVTTTPAADVLRVQTAVMNLRVNAPDTMAPGRSVTFSQEAGNATLAFQVRDSLSGELIGMAVDNRTIGDNMPYRRNSVTNRSDFEQAFGRWAKVSVEALDNLKSLSPINETTAPPK